jgi:hypothetical protein
MTATQVPEQPLATSKNADSEDTQLTHAQLLAGNASTSGTSSEEESDDQRYAAIKIRRLKVWRLVTTT